MDAQAYIILSKITVDYNIQWSTDSYSNECRVLRVFKSSVAKTFWPTGKLRILIRTEIRILHVWTSADPHFTSGLKSRRLSYLIAKIYRSLFHVDLNSTGSNVSSVNDADISII